MIIEEREIYFILLLGILTMRKIIALYIVVTRNIYIIDIVVVATIYEMIDF